MDRTGGHGTNFVPILEKRMTDKVPMIFHMMFAYLTYLPVLNGQILTRRSTDNHTNAHND